MTITTSTSDVADKAVSTDDSGRGIEVARLEAVLAALVKTKVEAIKASPALSKSCGSAPASPRRLRLTSVSTASSSLNHQYRKKDHHHYNYHQRHRHNHHHRRRHDSAPCNELIEDTSEHNYQENSHHQRRSRRRASESPGRLRKERKHSKGPNILQGVVQDVQTGLDNHLEHFRMVGDQDLTLIHYERNRETLSDFYEYPQLHRSASYFPQGTAQLNIHYDDDDYVTLNIADECEDDDNLSVREKVEAPREKFHRPRRKKRKRRKIKNVVQEELVDPEELPPRARWTIVATACLLLTMSLLLVGVTLRMAPIIDDMGNGRRNSVNRRVKSRRASTTHRKDSVRPLRMESLMQHKVVENVEDLQQARRHQRIAMIVLGTFLFLLAASILVVVVTLTHSTFLSPATGSKELAEHRAGLRRENEELLNSLNRIFVPENSTLSP